MSADSYSSHCDARAIPEGKANAYWRIIRNWKDSGKLREWLKDPESYLAAERDLLKSVSLSDPDRVLSVSLGEWCGVWLSAEGWKRLQSNVRQSNYIKGRSGSEPKRTLQIGESVASELNDYAKKHGLTLTEAIKRLLSSVRL